MKKTHLLKLSAFVVLCFMLTVCAFALDYEFDTEGPYSYFTVNTHISDIAVKDGCYTFKTVDTDPQIYLNNKYNASTKSGGLTDATTNKTFEIKFSTTLTSGHFEVFFETKDLETGEYIARQYSKDDKEEGNYVSNAKKFNFSGSGSLDDFITLEIDMSDRPYWRGALTHLRIDTGIASDATFHIDYIKIPGEPFVAPEPEVPAAPTKTQQILDEEKLYGECLFFDDFESYALDIAPSTIYYSKAGTTNVTKGDQCASYKVVTGIGGNNTKLVELISTGSYKYPMFSVNYVLEDKGIFTMLCDAYSTASAANKWAFHNAYKTETSTGDTRIRDESNVVASNTWQKPSSVHGTEELPGFIKISYFRYGASNVLKDEKIYIDNVRAYFKPYYYATVGAGTGTGESYTIGYVKGSNLTLPENTFTKDGYEFMGWQTNIGSSVKKPGEKIYIENTENLTITAVWAKFLPSTVLKNSIRATNDGNNGVRFSGYVSNANKAIADEYGFIVTRASLLGTNDLQFGENLTSGTGVTGDGVKYVYGACYTGDTDLVYANSGKIFGNTRWSDVTGTFFSAVLKNIPDSAYDDKFIVRPYAKVDGVYSYGDPIKRSARDIAQDAYDNGSREDYVMDILEKTENLPNKTVCFLGDSITHNGWYIRELFQSYLDSDNKELGRIEMYNCGISGDTAPGALKRIDDDVMYYDPDIVIIMLGMNDISGSYYKKGVYSEDIQAQRDAAHEKYVTNMKAIVEKLTGYGVEVILCTPTPYDDVTDTVYERSVGLARCAEFIREYAKEKNLKVVDHFANMYPICSQKYISTDFVHPTTLGQHVMAQSIMYSLGYIDEMEVEKVMTDFDEDNVKRATHSYNLQMMTMVERTLRNEGYTDLAAKKVRAAELRDKQTSDHWKWIYQNYLDYIDNAFIMREEVIEMTKELSYKH